MYNTLYSTSMQQRLYSAVQGQYTHLLLLELCHHVLQQGVVKVLSTQEGVAVGSLDLQAGSKQQWKETGFSCRYG